MQPCSCLLTNVVFKTDGTRLELTLVVNNITQIRPVENKWQCTFYIVGSVKSRDGVWSYLPAFLELSDAVFKLADEFIFKFIIVLQALLLTSNKRVLTGKFTQAEKKNHKAFQLKANRPLTNRCKGRG